MLYKKLLNLKYLIYNYISNKNLIKDTYLLIDNNNELKKIYYYTFDILNDLTDDLYFKFIECIFMSDEEESINLKLTLNNINLILKVLDF